VTEKLIQAIIHLNIKHSNSLGMATGSKLLVHKIHFYKVIEE